MNYLQHRELCEKLAAAYVLGTLRGPAARRFVRLAREHATIRLMVSEWEARLTPLAAAIPERAPPASLWQKISARIAPQAKPVQAGSLWASLAFWRGIGVAGSAAALVLFAVLMLRPPEIITIVQQQAPESAIPAYVAVLEDAKTHQAVFVAMAARDENQLVVKALDRRLVASDRDLELWALPPGAKPRSLGLVGAFSNTRITLASSADHELGNIPTLAISLEPKGGSPTGGPTGPVLYVGPLVKS
jgi:anti-sigma-K factor RskA